MTFLVTVALAGFAAGAAHVLMGADHLAAVAPLAVRGRRRAWRAGFRWGVGHAGGVAVVGLAALALRGVLPIDTLSHWSERFVGVVLVGIGVWAAFAAAAALRDPEAAGAHVHPHAHGHGAGPHGGGHRHVHSERAAFLVGLLHGTAGASHLVGVLPALALPSAGAAVAYLCSFGLGTVAAMSAFAALTGQAAVAMTLSGRRTYAGMMGTCAVASIGVGVYWLAG